MLRIPSSGGVEIAVHDLGGDGLPLLFAHATGFHGQVWGPVAAHLRDLAHCFALDERGHGDSTAPTDGCFDWGGFADDVLAAVAALGLTTPVGVGHSAGGAALLLAEIARPGTFRSLYCFEPIVMPFDPPLDARTDNPLSEGALRRRDVFGSKEEAYANFASKPPLSALHPDALWAYVEHGFADREDGTVSLKCRREHEAQTYRMSSSHDAFVHFGEIGCPVHLVCGATSEAITPSTIAAQATGLPRATTEVLDGLGHFGPLEDPKRVAASIAAVLAR